MLEKLKKEANHTLTENGALTYASTMSDCLDFFATAGGLRNAADEEIIKRFVRAYAEDADTAMKILFYARDVRGGLGERRLFRVILKFLSENHAESVIKNLQWIAEYGRYDDLLILLETPCEEAAISFFKTQFEKDMDLLAEGENGISLLAKWLPSINTSSKEKVRMGKKLARAFGMSEKEYRKALSALRKQIDILEEYLRRTDYSFDYAKQPGKAMLKYRKAFITFSRKPKLVEMKGNELLEKLQYISTYNEVADTNIQAVFELILRTAVKYHIPQEEMPERIFIISDMEFNACVKEGSVTNFEYAKKIFYVAGYQLPQVIFWNVASREKQLPVTKNEQGVTLVSGCSARLFEQVLSNQTDPYTFMQEAIHAVRYEKIVA